jgi:hypothetical protein
MVGAVPGVPALEPRKRPAMALCACRTPSNLVIDWWQSSRLCHHLHTLADAGVSGGFA